METISIQRIDGYDYLSIKKLTGYMAVYLSLGLWVTTNIILGAWSDIDWLSGIPVVIVTFFLYILYRQFLNTVKVYNVMVDKYAEMERKNKEIIQYSSELKSDLVIARALTQIHYQNLPTKSKGLTVSDYYNQFLEDKEKLKVKLTAIYGNKKTEIEILKMIDDYFNIPISK